jgi:predicted lipase
VTTAATRAATKAVGATAGMLSAAAAHTPGLEDRVHTSLHSGFWEAYCTVRGFIHTVIRQELAARPANVYCTGHSLGGALATIASLDLSIHTLPRINKYLKAQRIRKYSPVLPPPLIDRRLIEMAQSTVGDDDSGAAPVLPDYQPTIVRKVKVAVYTYGAPRVGNYAFAQQNNHWVPNNFRIGLLSSSLPCSHWLQS